MKQIKDLFVKACLYTTLMLFVIYIFAHISSITDKGITLGRFAIVFSYAFVVAFANLLKARLSLGRFLKLIIHYFITLSGFIFMFSFLGNMENSGPQRLFVAIILYTVFYALISTLFWLYNRHRYKDVAEPTKGEKSREEYTSLYGSH